MICQRGGLIIQRHNEIRDLEAELLDMVCHDVAVEPTLQPLTGEELNRGANTACTLSRILGETTDRLFRYTGMSPECGLVQPWESQEVGSGLYCLIDSGLL